LELFQNIRKPTNVVFVPMAQEDAEHVFASIEKVGDVGQDQVDAEHVLMGKHQSRVDDEDLLLPLEGPHVDADLAQAAQRQITESRGAHSSRSCSASCCGGCDRHGRWRRRSQPEPKAGVPFVLNARTDAFLKAGDKDPEAVLADAIERGRVYLDAGASNFFVPGRLDEPTVTRLVEALGVRTVNVIGVPGSLEPGHPAAPGGSGHGAARLPVGVPPDVLRPTGSNPGASPRLGLQWSHA